MPLIAHKPEGGQYEVLEAGSYAARCVSLIDIGTVLVSYKGDDKYMHKIRLSFELPTELKEFKQGEGEKPYLFSKEYTLSLGEKANLRKDLESWRGKKFSEAELVGFDLEKLLGKTCMVTIMHDQKDDKVYTNIGTISPVPKGMAVPDQINPTKVLLYDKWDDELFESLPIFLKDKITTSDEYQNMMGGGKGKNEQEESPTNSDDEINIDDIPF